MAEEWPTEFQEVIDPYSGGEALVAAATVEQDVLGRDADAVGGRQ